MEKITFCIPSKSNLRYLKTCIPSIRKNSFRDDHDIIVFVDSDEDGTVEWLKEVKQAYNLSYYTNPDLGNSLYGIGKAYDYCIEKSTTEVFMIFHADMMLGKHADLLAFSHLRPQSVVCSTRIEPPIHPNNGEKILLDFGMWPEEFKEIEFTNYVTKHLEDVKITNGIFAPWMMFKTDFLTLGGHDPIMHSCREDSDLFNRMKLAGFTFIQPWNSLVYHLTGRGAGSFDGDKIRHEFWQRQMLNSTKEFIRKWGSNVQHTNLMYPIVPHKYDIHAVIHNCNYQILELLEPWVSGIYCKCTNNFQWEIYCEKEQPNTKFDLRSRVKNIEDLNMDHVDVLLEFDANQFTKNSFNIIENLSDILTDSGEIGEFQLDCFHITITNLRTYEHELIKL
jgi:glycosyltransferase involved in cell wall biosynthesis